MGNGCVKSNRLKSNRLAIILGCMIRKEDFVVEKSVESKQLATIIDRIVGGREGRHYVALQTSRLSFCGPTVQQVHCSVIITSIHFQ